MRIAARKSVSSATQRREQLVNERLRAPRLRNQFPDIERLRIELVFNDPEGRSPSPSPQLHALHAAASAFFRFPCPCADCDGDFDLTYLVTTLMTRTTGAKRAASLGGHLSCNGVRFRDHAVNRTCPMQLNFQLNAEPRRAV
ncbi:MAG TPA: hypothetical protein VEY89_01145 [Candidatus Dormibacteraeota bacterium]|nr:hypothetical protein [Candidatus Dormibacteraeota bacterium]